MSSLTESIKKLRTSLQSIGKKGGGDSDESSGGARGKFGTIPGLDDQGVLAGRQRRERARYELVQFAG